MTQLDFVAIGDTVVDDFIRLKDAHVTCKIDNEECEICMRFGDKVPFESSTVLYGVGNAANAAVSAARLGLNAGFISNCGKDPNGDKIVAYFKTEKIETTYVVQHEGAPTNYHYVLWYDNNRTILINHFVYPYRFPADVPEPKIMYFSSIASGTESYHDDVATYLETRPNIFFVFQPGTFQIKLGAARLKRLYARANLLVVNKEEAQRILDLPETEDDVPMLLERLHKLGPKVVVISDDENGAYALENGERTHLPMYRDKRPPIEKTGAGDAFTSTLAVLYATGMPLKDAMLRGMVNASQVALDIGAQRGLKTRAELEAIIAAP
jgi:sugar/nucleoside kinase (ribokinase family)